MSYAAYKVMHPATGIENCGSGFISVSSEPNPNPNLIVTAANILQVYTVRVQKHLEREFDKIDYKRGGLLDGVSGASLELLCHYRLIEGFKAFDKFSRLPQIVGFKTDVKAISAPIVAGVSLNSFMNPNMDIQNAEKDLKKLINEVKNEIISAKNEVKNEVIFAKYEVKNEIISVRNAALLGVVVGGATFLAVLAVRAWFK